MDFFLNDESTQILSFRLEKDIDHASNSFVATIPRGSLDMVGKPFIVKNKGEMVFCGKVEALDFQMSAQERTFQIAGRDLGDLLDSDYVGGPFQWLGKHDFLTIAKHMARPFSVSVFSDKKLSVTNFTVKKGDSIAEIFRLGAAQAKALFFATSKAALQFTSLEPKDSGISLCEKEILTMGICEDHTKTFATYATASQVFRNTKDSPRTIFLRNKSPPAWTAQRRLAQLQTVNLTLPKFSHLSLGETLKLTTSLITGNFLIAGITWQMTPQEGPTTTLKLRARPHG